MEYINFIKSNEKGILKKIQFQKKSLEKYIEINIMENINDKYFYKNIYLGNYTSKDTFLKKIERKIQEILFLKKLVNKIEEKNGVIYLRYIYSTIFLLNFLKKLKNKNNLIIIEIPTYPYDDEIKKENMFTKMDKYYRKKLYKYVDRIVTYSEDKEIWGIPCINISNGIDLEEVKLVNKKEKNKEKIIFTSVSNCSFWHGIDRILKSLEKYGQQKKKKEIIFNIIGEGADSNNLKKIVDKSEYLSKVVKFQGFKVNQELDNIYNETDIGVGSLGRHRSGLHTMKALKNREYCAKGIPMIFSEDDPDLRDVPFVYHATADEELIDIKELIEWYEQLNLESKEIRKYSEKFSWDIQMKKVVDEIEKI